MSKGPKKLSPKQEGAILALLSQRSVEEAARAAGVTPRTLYRWMEQPDFRAAYQKARRAAFSQSVALLQQMTSAAVTTLVKIMIDSNAPAPSRVRAANCILNHATHGIEVEDLEARISALELAGPKQPN